MRTWPIVTALALGAGFVIWASDHVTLQGERTVYTVACTGGTWEGAHCTGRLVAGDRFRFRALAARHEVLFWRLASDEPSGKFTACEIHDGRNWTCRPHPGARQTITLQMRDGCAIHDSTGAVRDFKAVPKWQWVVLRWGIPLTSTASL